MISLHIHASRLRAKLSEAYARHGKLTHPGVVGISKRLDRVVVKIMRKERRN